MAMALNVVSLSSGPSWVADTALVSALLPRDKNARPPPPEHRPPSAAGTPPTLHRWKSSTPPPTTAAGDLPLHHQGQRSCLPRCLFSLLFFLEVAAPSSPSLQPASPPRLPRGCGTLLFFLATSAPSSSSSRPRPPIHLPRGRGPLLFFLLATATSLRAGSCPSGCSTGRLCPLWVQVEPLCSRIMSFSV